MENEEFLTVQQAAERLGVTDSRIRAAVLAGRLPSELRYGRKVIPLTAVDAYARERKGGRPRLGVAGGQL